MSEVIWYYDEAEGGGVQKVAGLGSYVKAEDFHDMEADRDAQRLRADTAEAERDSLRESMENQVARTNDYCSKLTGAEQCIAELVDLLTDAYGAIDENDGWKQLCTRILAVIQPTESGAIAALNPNPEAESHE